MGKKAVIPDLQLLPINKGVLYKSQITDGLLNRASRSRSVTLMVVVKVLPHLREVRK